MKLASEITMLGVCEWVSEWVGVWVSISTSEPVGRALRNVVCRLCHWRTHQHRTNSFSLTL
jgi:hypothetical protein